MPNPLRDYWIEFMPGNVPHTLPESFGLALFSPYFDYTLCINIEYSFISFVSFWWSLMGDGVSVGLCQETGFLALPRYALLSLALVNEALYLLVNSEISVVYP